jgi:hypothetical protein
MQFRQEYQIVIDEIEELTERERSVLLSKHFWGILYTEEREWDE